ncbi:MAG: hypothetical protein PHH11_00120 [Methylomonas sp.]|nr:hypothetical protein [Methylomonas sp.]
MHPRYRLFAMSLFIAIGLSGCGLFAVQEQHEKIASYCQIYGSVKPEVDNGKKMIVVLFKVTGPDVQNPKSWSVFDHFVNDGPGKWYFSTAPGDYRVGAFKDVNGDLIYQLDEPVFTPIRGEMIQCRAGEIKTDNDLIIPEQGRSNDAPIAVLYEGLYYAVNPDLKIWRAF